MDIPIYSWNDIRADYSDSILLGNGASVALSPSFKYRSLLQQAMLMGYIGDDLRNLFDSLHTENFEYVLEVLSQARRVNELLGVREGKTEDRYRSVHDALIKTVKDIHPTYREVEEHLPAMAAFMRPFRTVFSLNYDLLVYWAILYANSETRGAFKDCFVNSRFRRNWEDFFKSPGKERATLVFYPHGNLVLATRPDGREEKIAVEHRPNLLSTIIGKWTNDSYIPMFVSEGTSEQKMTSIRQSIYLSHVYNSVLPTVGESVVIFGSSVGENDRHIFDAILASGVKRLAVSVRKEGAGLRRKCRQIKARLDDWSDALGITNEAEVVFFDAGSPGCWINAQEA